LLRRPDDDQHQEHSGHNRHTNDTRQLAVIACAKAWQAGQVSWAAAARIYAELPREHHPDAAEEVSTPVLQRAWQNFLQHSNLKDAPRPGRPVIISKEDALAASELLKKGKSLVRHIRGGISEYVVYFTTVNEAIRLVPDLKAIMDKYNVSPHQLYLAMKREDPYLERRTVVLRPGFTQQQMLGRQVWCRDVVVEMGDTVPEQKAWWQDVVQMDEGKFTYTTKSKQHVRVYHDSREPLLCDFVRLPEVQGEQELSVHFVICVTPHPAFVETNGLVYLEFTTGTDYIKRLHNTMGQTEYEAFEYMVSNFTSRSVRC
jgi:hypothetical protein